MIDWLLTIGERFTPERYLALTRVQGIFWTAADYVIVIYLLRIANLLRRYLGRRQHRIAWIVLIATVPFALALFVAPTGAAFFRLELVVTLPHFALILYLCAANMNAGAAFLHEFTRHSAAAATANRPHARTRRTPPPE